MRGSSAAEAYHVTIPAWASIMPFAPGRFTTTEVTPWLRLIWSALSVRRSRCWRPASAGDQPDGAAACDHA